MTYTRTGNIALHVKDYAKALRFYRDVLGLPLVEQADQESLFRMESGLFYVTENLVFQGLVEEFEVDDVEKAREHLEENGCKVIRWKGPGKDCYMQDEFGMVFNLWQKGWQEAP